MPNKRFYISFGQEHTHAVAGQTFDKDSLMLVEAPGELIARLGINKLLDRKWSSLYQEDQLSEVAHYFPRGVINETRPVEVYVEGFKEHNGRLVAKCDGDHAGPPCLDPECWNQ